MGISFSLARPNAITSSIRIKVSVNGVSIFLYSGRNILRILPPLVISKEDVAKVLETLDGVLTIEEKKNNV